MQLTSYVDLFFLESQYFFKYSLYQKIVYILLKEIPMLIASLYMTHLSNLLVKTR